MTFGSMQQSCGSKRYARSRFNAPAARFNAAELRFKALRAFKV
jgi:hypothetical protein